MSRSVVVIPFSHIPKGDGWPPEGEEWRAVEGSTSTYPTVAQLRAAIGPLNPAEMNETFNVWPNSRQHWYCDVSFGPVEHRPDAGPYYHGPGFEVNAEVVDSSDHVPVLSLAFRWATTDSVFAVCQPLVRACGPLVAVEGGCGLEALLTEESELGAFRAIVDCEDVTEPG